MRLLLVDNFDSFVFNLAQAFGALGAEPVVMRNDSSLEELEAVNPDAVVISPGPGSPGSAGTSIDAIRAFAGRVPVLGVCLGHQCIAAAFGGVVERAEVGPVHGKTSLVEHDGRLPDVLEVSARSQDGVIMGVRHRELGVEGVQFHPESVLTPEGPQLLKNFLSAAS
jgi:anthranilate/para-aminobenzoate synthase component II